MTLMPVVATAAAAAAGLDPAWIAVIGAMFGGAGLRAVDHWLGKSKVKIDDATQIRDELREEIKSNRDEIKALEVEVDAWREKYYSLRDEYMALQVELLKKVDSIKQEVREAEKTAEELNKQPPPTPLTGQDGA